jgi:hypothetical protein
MQKYAFYSAWIEKSFEPNFLDYQMSYICCMGKQVSIEGDPISFKSIMRNIPRDKWHFQPDDKSSPCSKFPMIECPDCGSGILGDFAPHGIEESGRVYESVVCQNEGCNFHHHIRLEGWNHGAIPRGVKY